MQRGVIKTVVIGKETVERVVIGESVSECGVQRSLDVTQEMFGGGYMEFEWVLIELAELVRPNDVGASPDSEVYNGRRYRELECRLGLV